MKIINGNNIDLLKNFPDNYFDAVVTDPPYGLGKEPDAAEVMKDWVEHGYHEVKGSGFMGKEWDAFVPQPLFWKEVFRVLKHGGNVLAFYGTRTFDWGVMSMRFAGFEVRDCIQWIYGSGFPKSHNIGKSVYKFNGNEPKQIGKNITDGFLGSKKSRCLKCNKPFFSGNPCKCPKQKYDNDWEGWGSALKPAHEDLVLARKPFQFSSDFVYLYENIVINLKLQICQSKLFVKDAKEIFTLSQKELKGEGLDFAQWSVEKPFNIREDLLVMMDMLQLELKEGNMILSIVLSWLNILADLWNVANTYITETESNTITELRILNSLEWENIFQNITLLKDKKIDGLSACVLTAESLFNVLNLKLNDILTHSAKENATSKEKEKGFVPNSEPIVLARKPLDKGLSIAENVLKWGTGGINIDGCRIVGLKRSPEFKNPNSKGQWNNVEQQIDWDNSQVRFPANLILTHSGLCELKGNKFADENGEETVEDWACAEDCPIRIMDEQSGISKGRVGMTQQSSTNKIYGKFESKGNTKINDGISDLGGSSRFFYVAKASKSERNRGLEGFEEKPLAFSNQAKAELKRGNIQFDGGDAKGHGNSIRHLKNFHPTVKPVKLMQYLVRLITPPNGIVLDPFCGSGTTGIACKLEGFQFVGMEQDAEYCKIAEARIANYVEEKEPISVISEINNEKSEKDELPNNQLIQMQLF